MGRLSEESLGSIDGVEEIGKHDQHTRRTESADGVKEYEVQTSPSADSVENIAPLPALGMSLMFAVQLNEALMINVLYPFLVFMTESFGYTGMVVYYCKILELNKSASACY